MSKKDVKLYKDRNYFLVAFYYNGVRVRERLNLKSNGRKDAEKWAERRRSDIEAKLLENSFDYAKEFPNSKNLRRFGIISHESKNKTFSEVCEEIDEINDLYYKKGIIKRSTVKNYKKNTNILKKWFGEKYVKNISPADIKQFKLEYLEGVSVKTVNNKLNSLRNIIRFCAESGYIENDYADSIKNLKTNNAEVDVVENVFTEEEVAAILNHIYKYHRYAYAFYYVGFHTGMRIGELLAMKWSNIDWRSKTYFVQETMTEYTLSRPKTESSIRNVSLFDDVLNVLDYHKKHYGKKSKFIFVNQYGNNYISNNAFTDFVWKPTLEELGLRYRIPYNMRHTYATHALINGENLNFLARQLGHSSFEMIFRKYGKVIKNTKNMQSSIKSPYGESVNLLSTSKERKIKLVVNKEE
ncbi:MAG: tyrosine-type recombinase/integrase [Flexistipes sinusarabici]|uniref:Tyrosine-type recombinase/integrase n=1 Tax=Flexistipes sinusarabici TaxID=2352 RepID=A0A5D0MJE1_FLESI|nr:site-specific integrase [Flexistipes sinusarabici]TYB33096.1 MAG: tyrosine-type recombinase/integrase [Flexistipes sinusarabici]